MPPPPPPLQLLCTAWLFCGAGHLLSRRQCLAAAAGSWQLAAGRQLSQRPAMAARRRQRTERHSHPARIGGACFPAPGGKSGWPPQSTHRHSSEARPRQAAGEEPIHSEARARSSPVVAAHTCSSLGSCTQERQQQRSRRRKGKTAERARALEGRREEAAPRGEPIGAVWGGVPGRLVAQRSMALLGHSSASASTSAAVVVPRPYTIAISPPPWSPPPYPVRKNETAMVTLSRGRSSSDSSGQQQQALSRHKKKAMPFSAAAVLKKLGVQILKV